MFARRPRSHEGNSTTAATNKAMTAVRDTVSGTATPSTIAQTTHGLRDSVGSLKTRYSARIRPNTSTTLISIGCDTVPTIRLKPERSLA